MSYVDYVETQTHEGITMIKLHFSCLNSLTGRHGYSWKSVHAVINQDGWEIVQSNRTKIKFFTKQFETEELAVFGRKLLEQKLKKLNVEYSFDGKNPSPLFL